MTSHGVVVARVFANQPCDGREALEIDFDAEEFSVNGKTFKAGDKITIEGSSGRVVEGEPPLVNPSSPSRSLPGPTSYAPSEYGRTSISQMTPEGPGVRRGGHRPVPH